MQCPSEPSDQVRSGQQDVTLQLETPHCKKLPLVTYLGIAISVYGWTISYVIRYWIMYKDGSPNQNASASLPVVAVMGSFLGHIGFGSIADSVGRGRTTLCMMALLQAIAFAGASTSGCIGHITGFHGDTPLITELCLWVFLLCFALGGEYPVGGACIAESLSRDITPTAVPRALGTAYLAMGLAQLLVPLAFLACFTLEAPTNLLWRVPLIIGAALSSVSFGTRWYCEDEMRPSHHQESTFQNQQSDADWTRGLHLIIFTPRPLLRTLVGTCSTAFLSNLLLGSLFLQKTAVVLLPREVNGTESSIQLTSAVFIAALLCFPGYLMANSFAKQHRRPWQFGGFLLATIGLVGFAAAAVSHQARSNFSRVSYAMLLSVIAGSAHATAHFVPAEVFPTCVRATCIGLSMAAGDLGWACAFWGLSSLLDAAGLGATLLLLAVLSSLGLMCTVCLTPLYDWQTLLTTTRLKPAKDLRETTMEALGQAAQFRQCPGCEVMVERSGGCNVITCANCQDVWCFVCGGKCCTAWACLGLTNAGEAQTLETLPQILWPARARQLI